MSNESDKTITNGSDENTEIKQPENLESGKLQEQKTPLIVYGKDWTEIVDSDELYNHLAQGTNQNVPEQSAAEPAGNASTEQEKPSKEDVFRTYFLESSSQSTSKPLNLGIYWDSDQNKLRASTFIGAVPLIERNTKRVINDVVLVLSSRFDISPIEMIRVVLDSDEYWNDPSLFQIKSYTADEWKKGPYINSYNSKEKILFAQINGLPLIDLNGDKPDERNSVSGDITDMVGLFETLDFVEKAKDICRKNVMKKAQRVEENLVCKVKGRIVLNKQIKYNLAKGQSHKCYCSYNKMIDNNRENQILKYALYLCVKSDQIPEVLKEDIKLCMNALSGVVLKKCSISDFVGLKNNSAYRAYKEALEAAKKIISRFSINYNKTDHTSKAKISNFKVKPFFIDMNVLVELYCRAIIADVIKEYENLLLVPQKDSHKELYSDLEQKEDDSIYNAFMKEYIPDILIAYKDDKKGSEIPIAVLDAKNSDVASQGSEKRRERTHQVNFYMNALNVFVGGLISPTEKAEDMSAVELNRESLLPLPTKELVYLPLTTQKAGSNITLEEQHKAMIKGFLDKYIDNFKELIEQYKYFEKISDKLSIKMRGNGDNNG